METLKRLLANNLSRGDQPLCLDTGSRVTRWYNAEDTPAWGERIWWAVWFTLLTVGIVGGTS
jgi:hypothetical protein